MNYDLLERGDDRNLLVKVTRLTAWVKGMLGFQSLIQTGLVYGASSFVLNRTGK